VNSNSIPVNQGWNLIGPFAFDVQAVNISTIPPGIIASPFYGYKAGYTSADTLKPGKGYWIKSNADGLIRLNELIEN
jgi:hypothetical protein